MKYYTLNNITICLLLILVAQACAPSYLSKINASDHPPVADKQPHYEYLYYWAAHPTKWDPSDSITSTVLLPKRDTTVDIFFLHPTSFTNNFNGTFNADLLNDTINAKTDYSSILYQASIFNFQQNIFAPRYRQAHLQMYFHHDTTAAISAFDTAYADIRNAFQYYLSLNRNKPIIIAAHSQGTQHAKTLLKEFFGRPELQKKLIVAYLIGMPVFENELPSIPVCQDPTQTGCFVSWRTFRKNFNGPDYLSREPKAIVINPLTWSTENKKAPRSLHQGALLFNYQKKIPSISEAIIHENILWISRPKFPGSFLYTSKNYHVGDYNLFYYNIRQNAQDRITSYFQQH